MKLKRLIVFVLVACLLLGTPVQAAKGKRIKAKGVYYIDFILAPKYSGAKLKRYFKKQEKKTGNKWYLIVKTKFRGRTLKLWGAMKYKKSLKLKGKKKKMKYNKYIFKISRNVKVYGSQFNGYTGYHYWVRKSYSEWKKQIKAVEKHNWKIAWPNGRYYVKNGVVYKIVIP